MPLFTRRKLMQRGAAGFGALAGLSLGAPAWATLRHPMPRPIPGGFDESFHLVPTDAFFHAAPPGIGFEMSTITDFRGVVGGAEIRGTAKGSDGSSYGFDVDMRFMKGDFLANDRYDRRVHHGVFGF